MKYKIDWYNIWNLITILSYIELSFVNTLRLNCFIVNFQFPKSFIVENSPDRV